jgi:regulator of cell morphogenesis and NO signaling
MITPKTTVRQIVGRFPQTRRVFEKHGIDYCCGGKLTVEDAANQVRANLLVMIGDLDAALKVPPDEHKPEEKDWYNSPVPQLVAHILDVHHAYMHAALPTVRQLVAKVLRVHGPKHGDVLQPLARLYAALDTELTAHLAKEERVLFPMILGIVATGGNKPSTAELHCRSVAEPIAQMQYEHEKAGAVLDELRQVTTGYTLPPDACLTFTALYEEIKRMEADLHQHIHLENNILFPRILEMAK